MISATPTWQIFIVLCMVAVMGIMFYLAPFVQSSFVSFQLPGMNTVSVANK